VSWAFWHTSCMNWALLKHQNCLEVSARRTHEGERDSRHAGDQQADAARLGKVSDLLLDVANLQAGAVVLKTDGGQSMLPFGSIRNFGSDAVTVESTAAAHDAAEPTATGSMRGFRDLKGLPVANAQGTHLGEVTDLEIDVQGRAVDRDHGAQRRRARGWRQDADDR
jgi:sporulation protein YlmC with PRC-barrel domain